MMTVVSLFNFLVILSLSECYIRDPGPRVIATKGEIWPKPQVQTKYEKFLVVKPQFFEFVLSAHKQCTILLDALNRYEILISSRYGVIENNLKRSSHLFHKKNWLDNDNFMGYLSSANVTLNGDCKGSEYPGSEMIEEYQITVSPTEAVLTSTTIWGILRALESFTQSIYLGNDHLSLRINITKISDFPRFKHRGLLVDTSRHYIPVDILLKNLDAMAYNKMNVFHWHIVDDESFPYVSKAFPELSEKGAYMPFLVYTVADIKRIIEYARVRGIRVIPEFDSPGHTRSWGVAFKQLLTECYDTAGRKTGQLGPMDPAKNTTYEFLNKLFQEISELFPDEYVHIGGDEVGYECWESNPEIADFMRQKNITLYSKLESYYIQQLVDIVTKQQSKMIVWEEVFNNNVTIPNDTIVQVWISPFYFTLQAVIQSGKKALLSSCWYLDQLQNGGDWKNFYFCEPCINITHCENVLGGEACMWSEVVNEYNFLSRIWPRTAAVAERLWSSELVQDDADAEMRLEEHTCRLNRRDINAQPPTGPGFCN